MVEQTVKYALYSDDKYNILKKYIGWLLISFTPFIIQLGNIYPDYIKKRPALLFFTDELMISLSIFIFGVFFLIPILLSFCNKKKTVNKRPLYFVKNTFILILCWSLMIIPAFHIFLDISVYTNVEKHLYNETMTQLTNISDNKAIPVSMKGNIKRITFVTFRKHVSFMIPDEFLKNDTWEKVNKECNIDLQSSIKCKDLHYSGIFNIKKIKLLKHLTYAWSPEMPYTFILADNDIAKSMILKEAKMNIKNIPIKPVKIIK